MTEPPFHRVTAVPPGRADDLVSERTREIGLTVLPWVLGLYGALAAFHAVVRPLDASLLVAVAFVGAGAVTALCRRWLGIAPPWQVPFPLVVIGAAAVCSALVLLHATGDPDQTVALIVVLFGVSFLLVRIWALVPLIVVADLAWLVLVPKEAGDLLHWVISLGSASFLAAVIAWSRFGQLRLVARETGRAEAAHERLKLMARSLKLQNVELSAARDDAVRSAGLHDAFLVNVSRQLERELDRLHDPLGLLAPPADSTLAAPLREVGRSALALREIVDAMWDYAQVERGGIEVVERAFDLVEVVRAGIERVRGPAAAASNELHFEPPAGFPPTVVGDPERVLQVLSNLLSNAVKYTEGGKITADLTVDPAGAVGGPRVRITVRDTGIGLSPDQQAALFSIPVRDPASAARDIQREDTLDLTRPAPERAGLGLVISAQLVHLLGGEIGVNSAANEGATFWFTFPLRSA